MNNMYLKILTVISLWILSQASIAQSIPATEENIPYLVTFGKHGDSSWGDDDFAQIFFVVLPSSQTEPFFVRVYDPEASGNIDECKGDCNTSTRFAVYGGKGAITNKDARATNTTGNYKAGTLLASKTFTNENKLDMQWYALGPFNPADGELSSEYGGLIFKIVAEGLQGDDGNLYKYFISTKANENRSVEGANAFTFEYSFRLSDNPTDVSHIYPYIDENVVSIWLSNFDFDNDGVLRLVSVSKKGETRKVSAQNIWDTREFKITEEEKKTSIDVQLVKRKSPAIKSNNVTLFITNQYGEQIPFYTIPIGGVPKYKYAIVARAK